ncbi:putative Pectinesterase [Hibiscus syriacus]|uniref:Pectinesterase n=1 Tax=Hibiscus syriacus TaxID=106335 RepID=A0A6A2YTE7_HIBSY|nr:putative pectinesterase/pectinesterase inhibitor 45 [Hibiscus syriacus]KAE8682607.1 putative Pectinesterase [Hibiscus syriacus]
MVFQDFDFVQERRRQERQRALKKKIIIAVAILVIGGIAAAAAVAFVSMKNSTNNSNKKENKGDNNKAKEQHPPSTPSTPQTLPANSQPSPKPSTPQTPPANSQPSPKPSRKGRSQKPSHAPAPSPSSKPLSVPLAALAHAPLAAPQGLVTSFCEVSTYKSLCAETLTKTLAQNPKSATEPKELVKSFITSTTEELNKAFAKASTIKLNTEADRKAFDVCREVMDNAKEELQSSVDNVGTIVPGKPETDGDVNSWLSAVMAYQETCVDGFPEGPLKNEFRTTLNSSEVSTSISLAMIGHFAGLTNVTNPPQKKPAPKRSLLQTRFSLLAEDGLPSWMNHEERRLLKDEEDNTPPPPPPPNVIVAQDGTGKFKTINEALAAVPPKYVGRYVIFVKKGTYAETVIVAKRMVNLTIYGEGSQKTIITGAKNFVDGIPTYHTATFVASAPGFIARSIGFRNTAGPDKHQAVAARVSADKAIFLNCRFEGYQDTLYAHTHRQFYRSCVITGTIDFIFGDAAAVFQNCMIYVRKPNVNQKNIITAQGRKDKLETTGIVLQNCKILPDESFKPFAKQFNSYLGRPWKQYSRTVIMESQIEDFIEPAGWLEWEGDFALNTLFYGEFKNTGPGAITKGRVKWAGRRDINKEEAMKYTVEAFLKGAWVKEAGANVRMGLGT